MITRFRQSSIATKLRTLMMLACLLVIALTCVIFVVQEWITFRQDAVDTLVGRAEIISSNSSAALAFNTPEDAVEILAALKIDPQITTAVLYDAKGRLFASYSPSAAAAPEKADLPPDVHAAFSTKFLTVSVPILVDNRREGTIWLQRSLKDHHSRLILYAAMGCVIMGASGIVAFWLSNKLHRLVTDPVLELARAVTTVTDQKDYTVQVKRTAEDEIGRLTDAVNVLLKTIHQGQEETALLYGQLQRHATELELRVRERTSELLHANQELETFSSSISHDLRAPLRLIKSYSQILAEDYREELVGEAQGYLDKIILGTGQMENLINALLKFSRLGKQALIVEPIDMGAMGRTVFSEFNSDLAGRRVSLVLGQPDPSIGDRTLIHQVLSNLVSNALKFTRERDHAIIELGQVETPNEEEHIYYVKDNGVGFDPTFAHKLFVMFERLHDARQFEGTGVGLATVKRIMLRHGGRIWAESQPEAGATFFFALPTTLPAPSAPPAPPTNASRSMP